MSGGEDTSCGERADGAVVRSCDIALPDGTVALTEFRSTTIEHALGYFRNERFVLFGYCPGGGEVIWKDGHSSGFGTGGWRTFLDDIAPVAQQHGVNVGSMNAVGTHVLLIDRGQSAVFAVPRQSAEAFLAQTNGIAPPRRPCLCALLNCASCPISTCPLAGIAATNEFGAAATAQAASAIR